jgi:hypothetical protein
MSSPSETSTPRRRYENWIVALVLSFEVITPLTYYLGARGYDERFSWRMFSTLRLRDCKVHVTETPRDGSAAREVAVERDVQLAWLRLLERMRTAVVERYLQRRCAGGEMAQVAFECTCNDTDGRALPPTRRTLLCDEAGSTETP